jgi:hypothetical protein
MVHCEKYFLTSVDNFMKSQSSNKMLVLLCWVFSSISIELHPIQVLALVEISGGDDAHIVGPPQTW